MVHVLTVQAKREIESIALTKKTAAKSPGYKKK